MPPPEPLPPQESSQAAQPRFFDPSAAGVRSQWRYELNRVLREHGVEDGLGNAERTWESPERQKVHRILSNCVDIELSSEPPRVDGRPPVAVTWGQLLDAGNPLLGAAFPGNPRAKLSEDAAGETSDGSPHSQSRAGDTASRATASCLQCAAFAGQTDVLQALIQDYGLDPRLTGSFPLSAAEICGEIAKNDGICCGEVRSHYQELEAFLLERGQLHTNWVAWHELRESLRDALREIDPEKEYPFLDPRSWRLVFVIPDQEELHEFFADELPAGLDASTSRRIFAAYEKYASVPRRDLGNLRIFMSQSGP